MCGDNARMTGSLPEWIVDAHHHVWDLRVRDQPWITEDMAAIRRSFGETDLRAAIGSLPVDSTVVVQTVPQHQETPELLERAARSELVAGVVGWVDLTAGSVAEDIAGLVEGTGGDRLVGIRHPVEGEHDPAWLTRPDVLRGLRAVAAADLVYDLLVRPHQLPAAIEAVRMVPELTFVLDHLAKPMIRDRVTDPWAGQIQELATATNIVCKLSGLVTEAERHQWTVDDLRPFVDWSWRTFGPQRILFGSDWPVCTLAADYASVFSTAVELTAELSDVERDQVFARNAVETYRLTKFVTSPVR